MNANVQNRLPPIIIAAGGTGGHLFPAQALATEMIRRGRRLVLITDNRGEGFAKSFPGADVAHIRAATFAGAGIVGRLRAGIKIMLGIYDAFRILRAEKPRVVIGFGGYPSFPTMVAAMLAGIRRCVHEQNAILGRVNRVIATRINVIASTFGKFDGVSASINEKVVITGNPLRDPITARAGSSFSGPSPQGEIQLLVFGGSQGARIFSDMMPETIERLPQEIKTRLRVVQQSRPEDEARVVQAYKDAGVNAEVSSFFDDMAERIARAHLIICRSGASTVCEIAAIGRPAIFVPLPTAMDDHQTVNAAYLAASGAAWTIPQSQLSAPALADKLAGLFAGSDDLANAAQKARAFGRVGAAAVLADVLEDVEARRPLRVSSSEENGSSSVNDFNRAVNS